MAIDSTGVSGWKSFLINLFDRLFFRIPFLSEFLNQGVSKNFAILAGWHLISRIELEGDYFEFGVFRGETFRNSILAAKQGFRATREGRYSGRFFAFDSFEGLPSVASMKEVGNVYAPGEFSASRQVFDKTLGNLPKRYPVHIIPGWFDKTLTPELAERLQLKKAAFVNVDCDLYESTIPILEFILPFLQTGTVLYFDDWFSIKGSMNLGEPKACSEWLERNPKIKLVEYRNAGITGKMFIVNCLD